LGEAEGSQHALWSACQSFARDVISRGARVPAKQDVSAFVRQLDVIPRYWSILEPHFHELLSGYAAKREFEDLRADWLSSIRYAVHAAWRSHASIAAFGDAWTIRALVKAEGAVIREIRKLDGEITQLNLAEIGA
jgi:CRISPR system Cascade subunit CasA